MKKENKIYEKFLNRKNLIILSFILCICFMVFKLAFEYENVDVFDRDLKKEQVEYEHYKQFVENVEKHLICKVEVSNDEYIYYLKDENNEEKNTKIFKTDNPRKENFKEMLLLNGVEVVEKKQTQKTSSALGILTLFIVGMIILKNNKSKELIFLKENKENEKLNLESNVNFSKIAGNDEAKESLYDIVDFLKNPEKYKKHGAKMPKGIIFYGPPGTGKTLMARALAKEAEVDFFSTSGSDFVEMYVGVGASRVRDLFRRAKEKGKAVIFIDEIDALGRKRKNGKENGNEERDQTLNALLTEMSGFSSRDGIVVVAATNRIDILDEALLRPGRFDRQIEIGLPNKKARHEILKVHTNEKTLDKEVNLEKVAEMTTYFSGAMLENLINEAAINSVKNEHEHITKDDIEKAYFETLVGKEKNKDGALNDKDKRIIAFHESGHVLVRKLLNPKCKISKVTILPTSKGAGGFTASIPEDKLFVTKKDLENEIKVLLAGRAAEEIKLGKEYVTTGASNDLEKVKELMDEYIRKFGMDDENVCFFEEVSSSEYKNNCKKLINSCYKEVKDILNENMCKFDEIIEKLIIEENLYDEEINKIINNV